MQDGIIAGNGNSRYLKTVAAALSLYPDYESFMAALVAGTFPIDLNGINAGGWTQQGTPLNKANLFSDSTASALGLTSANTPNDALAKIKNLIDSANANANTKTQMEITSYVGTGTAGSDNPCSITFSFSPDLILYIGQDDSFGFPNRMYDLENLCVLCSILTTSYQSSKVFGMDGKKSSDGKTVFWYDYYGDDETQLNKNGSVYYFAAFKRNL